MVKLFVARDAGGRYRFIGDVARGSACGCFCLACGSPLIARKADILEWHFAHEASQERPECHAGATNLLRRLAVEELDRGQRLSALAYSIGHPLAGRPPITWTAQPTGSMQFLAARSPEEPAASISLVQGGEALIHVCIGREDDPPAQGQALAVLRCPLPLEGKIHTEEQARAFVRNRAELSWLFLPDYAGLLETAAAELRSHVQRKQQERSSQAGAWWAAQRRKMDARSSDFVRGPSPAEPAPTGAQPAPAAVAGDALGAPDWAPGLLRDTSMHFRELDDGTRWLCYQDAPGRWQLRPVPSPQDGWDETFPPSVAVPEGPTWLRVVDFSRLLMMFNRHAVRSEITSDPRAISRHFSGA